MMLIDLIDVNQLTKDPAANCGQAPGAPALLLECIRPLAADRTIVDWVSCKIKLLHQKISIFYQAKITNFAVLPSPARLTGALPMILAIGARSADARIRRALVDI